MLTPLSYVLITLAAMAAGAVNALAGGGTLITFPALTLLAGIPAVSANITSTVSLCPGYFGGTLAQFNDLRGQTKRLWMLVPAGAIGGVLGGFLLLQTGERLFRDLVPYLILLASGLLAIQDPVRAWLTRRMAAGQGGSLEKVTWLPVGLASVYGGYFGAGLSVIVLSALGLTLEDSLTRLNALKQAVAFSVNVAAAIFFLFSGQVVWTAALVMAVGALVGGVLGGKLAGVIKPSTLRWTVITIGVIISIIYFVRG
ncbi:MAG: sulfite exporter TauE/SafE family protein [Anaerolineales bacterium]|nr:sulfite exporter TauE/SafE family protein [Anaerolineae bacterium]PWB72580.1 MAG: sulfite exporter TauE/SafE family protein [Anaerolineales bacterium]